MKKPSIVSGIAFAFAATVVSYPVWWVASSLLPFPDTLRLISALVYLGCVGYLLWTRKARVGSLTLSLVNLIVAAVLVPAPLPTSTLIMILAVLLSLNRSLLWHRGVMAIALDMGLTAVALLFAEYLHVHPLSFVAPLWGFLLVQAAWPLIPSPGRETGPLAVAVEGDPFIHGQRQADAALRRIMEG